LGRAKETGEKKSDNADALHESPPPPLKVLGKQPPGKKKRRNRKKPVADYRDHIKNRPSRRRQVPATRTRVKVLTLGTVTSSRDVTNLEIKRNAVRIEKPRG